MWLSVVGGLLKNKSKEEVEENSEKIQRPKGWATPLYSRYCEPEKMQSWQS